jgi:DNA replication protein DnaC
MSDTILSELEQLAARFRLPTIAAELGPRLAAAGHADALAIVHEVFVAEGEDRHERRVQRLMRKSCLPPGKTFDTLEDSRFSRTLMAKIRELAKGDFLDASVNVLAFGLPGTGKTHVASAIAQALIAHGRSVLFTPTFRLVQQLLEAKRDLALPKLLKKLDHFELLVLDDIGYVQQSEEEIEVLFTLLAERYERRSLLITSNLVFSEWDKIFKNPMTTAAAIDRLVHHSVILEFAVESYRSKRKKGPKK